MGWTCDKCGHVMVFDRFLHEIIQDCGFLEGLSWRDKKKLTPIRQKLYALEFSHITVYGQSVVELKSTDDPVEFDAWLGELIRDGIRLKKIRIGGNSAELSWSGREEIE